MLTSVVEAANRSDGSTVGLQYVKCNKYWPDNVGDSKKFGDMQVQLFDRAEVIFYRKNSKNCFLNDYKMHFEITRTNSCVFRLLTTVFGSWT